MANELIAHPNSSLIESAGVHGILDNVRPYWKGKRLIERVINLLKSDPSSACQRVLNAAIQDLREKIVIAGIDIAKEAAISNRLPPINRPEDVENYSTKNIIDISYYIGFLTRPEWRRLARCYEIRRDLEHEDDEYEAGVEDCVYIFKTAVDVVLSRDPIKIVSVTDIVDQIESPNPIMLSTDYLNDYEHAPKQRQIDIVKMLIGKSLNDKSPEILKENSITCLKSLKPITQNQSKVELGSFYQEHLARKPLNNEIVYVMHSAGLLAYFTSAAKTDYFNGLLRIFNKTGYHWKKWSAHSELLQILINAGGLESIPAEIANEFIVWLFKCYLGEPGGYGAGRSRRVFYSNTGAPICYRILKSNAEIARTRIQSNSELKKDIERAIDNQDIQRRYDELIDCIEL